MRTRFAAVLFVCLGAVPGRAEPIRVLESAVLDADRAVSAFDCAAYERDGGTRERLVAAGMESGRKAAATVGDGLKGGVYSMLYVAVRHPKAAAFYAAFENEPASVDAALTGLLEARAELASKRNREPWRLRRVCPRILAGK